MTEQHQPCLICERVTLWRSGQNPYFIQEFEHSIFVIGDHPDFSRHVEKPMKDLTP